MFLTECEFQCLCKILSQCDAIESLLIISNRFQGSGINQQIGSALRLYSSKPVMKKLTSISLSYAIYDGPMLVSSCLQATADNCKYHFIVNGGSTKVEAK